MRYRLRTLSMLTIVGPPLLALAWWAGREVLQSLAERPGNPGSAGPPGSAIFTAAATSAAVLFPLAAALIVLALRKSSATHDSQLAPLELAALITAAFAAFAALVLCVSP